MYDRAATEGMLRNCGIACPLRHGFYATSGAGLFAKALSAERSGFLDGACRSRRDPPELAYPLENHLRVKLATQGCRISSIMLGFYMAVLEPDVCE